MARRKVMLPNWANTEEASKSVEMLNEAFEGLTQGELVINTKANNTLLTTLNENGTPVIFESSEMINKRLEGFLENIQQPDNKDVLDGIDSEKVAAWDKAVEDVNTLTSAVTGNEKVVAAALNQIVESVGLDENGNSPLPGNISLTDAVSALSGSSHAHENKGVLDDITEARVTAWDAAKAGAISSAKTYVDSLDAAMDARVDVLEVSSHTHTNKTVLDGITAEKVTAWDTAEANAISSARTYTDSAITALNLAETYAKKEVETKISTLIGEDTNKSIRSVAAEEVAKIVNSADTRYDTLKEIADWIISDTTGAASMANDITALKAISADTRLETLESKKHEHTNKEVLDGITAIKVAAWDAAEANASAYTDSAIKALDLANTYEAKGAAADAFASAKTYTDGLDAAMGSRVDALTSAVTDNEKVVAAALNQIIESVGLDGSGNSPLPGNISLVDAVSTLSGSNHTHANKTVLDGITSDKVAAWDAAKADAISSAKTYIDSVAEGKADAVHTHAIANVTGLQDALDGKAASAHTHAIADVTGLQGALDGKAASAHTHAIADVTGLQDALDEKDSIGAAAQALTDAKAYTDAQIKTIKIDCGEY